MRRNFVALVTANLLALSTFTSAVFADEPAMRAEEIVQKFIASANLGKARAICIGSDAECATKQAQASDPLNMRIGFEYNSAVLTSDAKILLDEFVKAINDDRLAIAKFSVEGHTDAHGGDAYNFDLSAARAKTITDTLISLGVASERISAQGFGEAKPRNSDPFSAENRRVEARIIMPAS